MKKEDKKLKLEEQSNSWEQLSGEEKWGRFFKAMIMLAPIMILVFVLNKPETAWRLIGSIKENIPFLQTNFYSLETDIGPTNKELNAKLINVDIWEVEKLVLKRKEKWLRNKQIKTFAVKYEYLNKIIDCKEFNIPCFVEVRKELNFKKKIIAASARVEIGHRFYFDRLKKKWPDWDREKRVKYIFSLLEHHIEPHEFYPEWLKKEQDVIDARKQWYLSTY